MDVTKIKEHSSLIVELEAQLEILEKMDNPNRHFGYEIGDLTINVSYTERSGIRALISDDLVVKTTKEAIKDALKERIAFLKHQIIEIVTPPKEKVLGESFIEYDPKDPAGIPFSEL